MRNVRIAYFIDHLKVGGAQRHLVEVVRRLDRRRFSPQVWTLRGEGEYIPEVERLSVPVQNFGLGKRLPELKTLSLLWEAVRKLRRQQIHIVHCYLSSANLLGTVAAAWARTPVLLVSKRSLDSYPRQAEAWAHWSVNRFADRVVANAQAVKQCVIEVEGCPADKITVIPNGIDDNFGLTHGARETERTALGLQPDDLVIGTLGRLAWKKGHEYFLQTAALVLQRHPRALFVVVGDGPLRSQLEQQAQMLGIASRVKFLGQRLDSEAAIALFDIFVLPSVIEGMSNALLEAMALQKPVVVTDVGGNAEVVSNAETGFVVPSRQPEAMAAALSQVLDDRQMARRMGTAARQTILDRFSLRRMVEAMETLYEELLVAKGVQV